MNKRIIGGIIILMALGAQFGAYGQLGGCWGLGPVQCEYNGPQTYTCGEQTYTVTSFSNTGTHNVCGPPAGVGLTYCIPNGTAQCGWSFSYICNGILVTKSGTYDAINDAIMGTKCYYAFHNLSLKTMLALSLH